MNIKKIIAREGLIIIGFAMLLSILLFLNQREKDEKFEYMQSADTVEIVEVLHPNKGKQKTTSGYEYEIKEIVNPTGIYVMLQKPTDMIRMQEILGKDFPKLNNPSFVVWDNQGKQVAVQRYYDSIGDQKKFVDYNIIIPIAILLYPGYLVVRFVYWAMKTLRQ